MGRRRNAVYLVIIVSLLAGLATRKAFFFNVAYAFAGLFFFSLFWAWSSASGIKLQRHIQSRRSQVGQTLEETFLVRNTGLLPKLWLEVYDQSTLPGHRASHVISSLGSRSEATWVTRTLCVQRGIYHLGPLRIVTGDPFGLFQAEKTISDTTPLIVYPATIDIPNFHLPVGVLSGGDAQRQRTHQITTNAAGVRDYAAGDSFSRIHWPSTARRRRIIVKEFELDPLADIWIMLDSDQTIQVGEYDPAANGEDRLLTSTGGGFLLPPTTEEYAVASAASLAIHFLQKDRAVGFATHGQKQEIIQVDRGARQRTKILETLAVVRSQGTVPFSRFISLHGGEMARGTTLVLVTASTRESWVTTAHELIQRGLRVVAVVIDSESFGGRPGGQATALHLGRLNIPTYLVRHGDDLRLALTRPLIAAHAGNSR
jgi:uncharacterized protein (DUF58 family)